MYVRKFLTWAATAPTAERAPAAAELARALLNGELPREEEYEAGIALASFADDPSPLVRLAVAREIAPRADAPRHLLVTLAVDQSSIAVPILRQSPALSDAELIDAAIVGDPSARAAIAGRARVSASVCAALVEIGERDCVVSLLDNKGAEIPASACARAFERYPADPAVREALLVRNDLDPALRTRLVEAAAASLRDFVVGCGWMSPERADRVTRDSQEKSFVLVAGAAPDAGARTALARQLRESGRLTPALLLRSLLSGDRALFESALAELTGVGHDRAAGVVNNFGGGAFAALYGRGGLPEALLPVFRFALEALARLGANDEFADGGVQRSLVEPVLSQCEKLDVETTRPVLGLLRRLHAEAARQEAREFASWVARTEAMDAGDSGRAGVVAALTTEQSLRLDHETGQLTGRIGELAVARALNLAA